METKNMQQGASGDAREEDTGRLGAIRRYLDDIRYAGYRASDEDEAKHVEDNGMSLWMHAKGLGMSRVQCTKGHKYSLTNEVCSLCDRPTCMRCDVKICWVCDSEPVRCKDEWRDENIRRNEAWVMKDERRRKESDRKVEEIKALMRKRYPSASSKDGL